MEPEPSYTSPLQRVQTAWRWAIRPSAVGWSVPPLLALILLLAFLVRIYGIEWDQNGLFHPDERSVYLRTDCMYRLLVESPGWESCTAHDPFRQIEPGFPSLTVFLDADSMYVHEVEIADGDWEGEKFLLNLDYAEAK